MTALHKLRSQSGASMVLALFFFFFCAAVGAIVLTAATANAGRTARLREAEQHRLTAESSARLLRDSLSALSFRGGHTEHNWMVLEPVSIPDPNAPDGFTTSYVPTYYGPNWRELLDETQGEPYWVEQLNGQLKTLYYSKTPVGGYRFQEVPIQFALTGDGMMDSRVAVTLTLTEEYVINVTLARGKAGEEDVLWDNHMQFTLTPKLDHAETTRHTPVVHDADTYIDYTTTVTWTAGDIKKGVTVSETPAP